jgi:hypothetical protein
VTIKNPRNSNWLSLLLCSSFLSHHVARQCIQLQDLCVAREMSDRAVKSRVTRTDPGLGARVYTRAVSREAARLRRAWLPALRRAASAHALRPTELGHRKRTRKTKKHGQRQKPARGQLGATCTAVESRGG